MNHLFWKTVNTPVINIFNDTFIEYNGKIYQKVANIRSVDNDRVVFSFHNQPFVLIRNNNPYLYKDIGSNQDYLVFANSVYMYKQEHNNSHLEPQLIDTDTNTPFSLTENIGNLLIEGDNIQGLTVLLDTHKNSIDLITIDPPYNTRNKKMRYNDYFPILDNNDEHSAWLSFMYERLVIAKELLSQDGIILINIDEFEYPYLKLLCDHIFSFNNAVETFIWEKNSTKNNSKTTSTNHEYILCYAKDIKQVEGKGYFRQEKPGIPEIQHIKQTIVNDATIPNTDKKKTLEKELAKFYKDNPYLKGIKHYKRVDDNLNIFRISDVSAPAGEGLDYDIIHPVTGKVCKKPAGGFRYNKKTIEEHINNDRFYFGKDEKTVPQFKRYLDDMSSEIVKSVIRNTSEGKKDLEDLFGYSDFNNPKPVSLIKTFIGFIPKKSITCLDFFAGSGTAGHAVMEYNKEHNTNHSFIMITNNENNICYDVTKPRIEKAIEKYQFDETFQSIKIRIKPSKPE